MKLELLVQPYQYDYPRPALAVDIFCLYDKQVLLIKRRDDPFAGKWALPGGYVNEGETPEAAARRELYEETGTHSPVGCMHQVRTFARPGRDPRGWVVSVLMKSVVCDPWIRPGDDAVEAQWFPVLHLPELAFDHEQMILTALGL